jgi:hypothetical protein
MLDIRYVIFAKKPEHRSLRTSDDHRAFEQWDPSRKDEVAADDRTATVVNEIESLWPAHDCSVAIARATAANLSDNPLPVGPGTDTPADLNLVAKTY